MLEWFEKHLHGWDSDIIGPFVEEALFAYFDAPEELQGQAVDFVIVNNKNPMHDASGFMMLTCDGLDEFWFRTIYRCFFKINIFQNSNIMIF